MEQNGKYLILIATSLLRSEEEMRQVISTWTRKTASERVQSNTSLEEVVKNSGSFRQLYWQFIEKFVKETTLDVGFQAFFNWERKINFSLDYVFDSFTVSFMKIITSRLESQASLIRELSAPVITLSKAVFAKIVASRIS